MQISFCCIVFNHKKLRPPHSEQSRSNQAQSDGSKSKTAIGMLNCSHTQERSVLHYSAFLVQKRNGVFSRRSMDGICRSLQNFKSNKKQYYLLLVKYLRCTFVPCISSSVDKIYFLFTEVIFFHPITKLLLLNWMRGVDLI